ncbi:hypothetical protein A1O1_02776 [Capronia coronata CBS 617.96]|uniref:Major facilitator superfamily (MFS) profile domain-containing protein n=1 Tax=Capronia coronata CBS 617.96 TaxID=1182541 RepID=W9YNA9_9EURO|nr:uncharacterized protein A1O1_02776 [Capronia coronata CBS 617.96]EXJ94382.1 hypothetical protein A1O1_02776 [Capronia coronata CBS 617.96]
METDHAIAHAQECGRSSRSVLTVKCDHDLHGHETGLPLQPMASRLPQEAIPAAPFTEPDAQQYKRFSPRHKVFISGVLAFCALLSPVSSTMVLSAIPEVAHSFATSGNVISLSNALYLLFMGLSACFWGPISNVYGRRWAAIMSALQFCAFNVGTAMAPNLAAFYVFRILTALQGTGLLIMGSSCLGDIYEPTTRATALGWFSLATVFGSAFGPFAGGVIVTFRSWRVIFWLQAAMGGVGTVLLVLFLPETLLTKKIDSLGLHDSSSSPSSSRPSRRVRVMAILSWISPWRVLVLLVSYPNLLATGLASSALIWNMYSLLTPIRYVLNPRFQLTSPLQAGLFYIAPGCGYLAGSPFGGRWADHTVKKWIRRRDGRREPEDRLRSSCGFLGVLLPACVLLYGWSVQKQFGAIPLPAITLFLQGAVQWLCFPSLNTYALDVMQHHGLSAEVVAGNYMIRYIFAAIGSAVCLPAIQAMGVGWFSTVSAALLVLAEIAVWATTVWGASWRERVDEKRRRQKMQNS